MNEVHKHTGEEFFFLRTAFGNQQRHGYQGVVDDALGSVGTGKGGNYDTEFIEVHGVDSAVGGNLCISCTV